MRGFVFDLDNTLFDRYATIRKIMETNWAKLKPYINIAYDLERAYSHFIHTEALFIIEGKWEVVYDHLLTEHFFNAANTPDCAMFRAFIVDNFFKTAVPFDYAKQLLSDIHAAGYKLGIITNGHPELQYSKIKILGYDNIFDEIIVSGEFAQTMCGDYKNFDYWKPGRAIFDEMSARLNIPAGELYYVGDNPKNDVSGAENAGYVPVWIMSNGPWPYENEKVPRHRFYSIEGLRSLI